MEMELDAGALMSEESFKRIKRNGVTLQESKVKLYSYTGYQIKVIDCADVGVEHKW